MKSVSQNAYEKVRSKLLAAPGMIEEIERRILFKAAYNCSSKAIVEFGSFFGASTLALASGLEAKNTNRNPVISIDAFEVERDHFFFKYVKSYAQSCKAEHLLINKGTKVNWQQITEAVLGKNISRVKLLPGIVDEKFDMSVLPDQIGLLHLDLPKDAKTLMPILKNVFPRLVKGSIIAFQDYAYQHSNELIAIFELLENRQYISKVAIAASSVFYEVRETNFNSIDFDRLLQDSIENELPLIQEGIKKYVQIEGHRDNEVIALEAAAIRSIITKSDKSAFKKQKEVAKHIANMLKISSKHAVFVLSDILTQSIEEHK